MIDKATQEATKDTARTSTFVAISTLITYVLGLVAPDMEMEVKAAIVVVILALLTYVDSKIHHSAKVKAKGLLNLLFKVPNF